jgi:hypothetical protein
MKIPSELRRTSARRDSRRDAAPPGPTDLPALRFQRLFRRFPISVALAMPYVILILPQAVWNQNEHIDFIIGIFAIAIAGSLFIEVLVDIASRSRRPGREAAAPRGVDTTIERLNEYGPALRRAAYFVSAVGMVVGVLSSAAGIGSIQSQIGLLIVSAPLAMASALVGGWPTVGAALLIAARMAGQISPRALWIWLGVLTAGQLVEAYLTALTASLMAFATSLTMMMLLFGIIRIRYAVAALLAVLIVWPIAFDIRNDARESSGVAVSTQVGAFDRLRFDQQITRALEIEEVPLDLGQPGPIEMVRYGLIPRALDPDRPTISTGIKINIHLGGSATSTYTFLPVTTTYVLGGPLYLILWYAFWAALTALVLRGGRNLTVLRIVVVGLVFSGPLGWFSTFPDRTIGVVQFFVSFLPILLFFLLEKSTIKRRRTRELIAAERAEMRGWR